MGLITTLVLISVGGIIALIISWILLAASLFFGSTASTNLNDVDGYDSNDDLQSADGNLTWQAWIGWIYIILSIIAAIAAVIIAVIATVVTGGVDFEVTIPALILALGIILVLNVVVLILVGILAGIALLNIIKAGTGNDQNVL